MLFRSIFVIFIAAIGLYEGLGFQVVGRRPKYYVDTGEDALLMTRVVS